MSKQITRKQSPSTVRPASPRVVDPRKHSPRAVVSVSRNRKSPSLFEPSSSFTDRVGFNGSSGQQNVKPKPFRSHGMLDDIDLLSQSAYFDEADSEIQSIYERVVKDSTVQSSLQEIIAAQKLQAAYAHSHTQLQSSSSSSSPSQSNTSSGGQGQGQGQPYNHKGMSSSSSSFFATASHFAAPPLSYHSSSSSRLRENSQSSIQGQGQGQTDKPTGAGQGQGQGSASVEPDRLSLDEDQKSDNTTAAGYMLSESIDEAASNFSDFCLPQPETMSDDALVAMVEFAHKEMWKRNNPASKDYTQGQGQGQSTGSSKGSGERRRSSPANTVQPGGKTLSTGGSGRQLVAQGQGQGHNTQQQQLQQRRPRSKSGGSESALTGRDEGQGQGMVRNIDDSQDASNRSPYSYDDDCVSSDSGRVRPLEKMLGLTPGYLRKPSPANSPGHFQHGPKGANRASPWLVFDPPHAQESFSPHHLGRHCSSPALANSPSRTFSSSSPICIGSNGSGQVSGGAGGGPIRLPAKKVTSVPMTLFSPEEHGEKRRKADYFSGSRHEDDDSHSFVSVSSSVGSGMDRERLGMRTLQQQLQQHLVISPRTAFDDISVTSSEGSSSGKKCGYGNVYRKPPVPVVSSASAGGKKR